jgi:branched-subunit amino acid ABC-type transport system permease component
MHDLIAAFIRGFPIGCVFALMAGGLVLTYKTSGVFNLAFGAQSFTSAAVYFVLHVRDGWPIVPAVVISVFVVAPAVGVILNHFLFRHLRTATPVAKLAVSLGVLVALPAVVSLLLDFGSSPAYGPQGIVPNGSVPYRFGSYAVTRDELATIILTIVAVVGLTILFKRTAMGLQMRAVVESPRLTELTGVDADRVSTVSWMLSSTLAGLAGVLLSPLYPQVSPENFFVLVVAAIAAAAFAGLTSLPLAFLGGILLGVANQILAVWLKPSSIIAQGLRPSLPFVALFLVLILSPAVRRKPATDPLAGVDPPLPPLAAGIRSATLTRVTRVAAVVAAAIALWWATTVADDFWLAITTETVIFGIIFLSITVITGMAGQISLAQATFAAIGAFATAQLADRFGVPVLVAMVAGAVVAAAAGALLAIPALRLGGIHLALATLAFALFFENVLVRVDWIGGGAFPTRVPRPLMGPIDFSNDKAFLGLCVVLLAIVALAVRLVRGGTTGRYLRALAGSEVAAASVGINPARARITAFALSAALAGIGGGLLVMRQGQANYDANFTTGLSLFWVAIVVTLGTGTIEAAIFAAIAYKLTPQLLHSLHLAASWQAVIFGLGALTFVRHPEGLVENGKRRSLAALQRLLDRLHRPGVRTDAPAPEPSQP